MNGSVFTFRSQADCKVQVLVAVTAEAQLLVLLVLVGMTFLTLICRPGIVV